MKISLCWILLGLCSISISLRQKHKNINELMTVQDLLRLTLNSLKGNLDFLNREIQNVNLDAIIGTRIVDGSLAVLIHRIEHNLKLWSIDGAILQEIRALQALVENISDTALPFVQSADPNYYNRKAVVDCYRRVSGDCTLQARISELRTSHMSGIPEVDSYSGEKALTFVFLNSLEQGSLAVLIHRIEHNLELWPIDGAILQEIRALQALAENISDTALPFVQSADPKYYNRSGRLLQKGFWRLHFASKDFRAEDFSHVWYPRSGQLLRGEGSDFCISELFGTGPYTNAKCQITPECCNKMTALGYNGYSLTHETFYLIIGYQMGCLEEMNIHRMLLNQPPLDELVKQFCAATYLEALHIEKLNFPPMAKDLFMEKAALCGLAGYRWFFSPSWIQKIISWQDKQSGCFKLDPILYSNPDMNRMASNAANVRVKREERMLKDGCLSHMTAGALAIFKDLRYSHAIYNKDKPPPDGAPASVIS